MSNSEAGYTKKDLPVKVGKIGLTLLGVGLVLGIAGYFIDSFRASYSYLISFMYLLSIGIGSLFLVALEYIAGASWSTPFRRIPEFLSSVVPYLFILVIPLIFSMHDLFRWTHPDVIAKSEVLQSKAPYLNTTFFVIRVAAIFGIWTLFYYFLTKHSRQQDTSKDQRLTKYNIKLSAIFMPIFAITLSFAAVDWIMSLEASWYSTIFGVYFFAGATVSSLAAVTLITVLLKEKDYLHSRINNEHYYSLGTLMFAFTAFWGYIAFSQYMLIWYGDLPEETMWFIHRWNGGWKFVSIILMLGQFIVPFFSLISHKAKTNPKRLKFMAVWILCAHFIDIYWMVMPSLYGTGHSYSFSWLDVVYPLAVIGILIILFNLNSKKYNMVPIGDPKLERGLDFRL